MITQSNARQATVFALGLVLLLALAGCAGNKPAPTSVPAEPTNPPPTQPSSIPNPTAVPSAALPKACALLTLADVQKISGYTGGDAALGPGMEEGESTCQISTGQGKLRLDVGVSKIRTLLPANSQLIDLEGSGKGVIGEAGWLRFIRFANFDVTLLASGSAVTTNADKKIAQVTKADNSIIQFAPFYESLARTVAHNVAGGAQQSASVIDLNTQGDPCKLLTLDDVKQTLTGFTVTGPTTKDSTYGGKQCVYQFTSDSLKAAGFAALEFITPSKYDSNAKTGQILQGIGDAAAISPSGGLQVKKGNTLIYLTMSMDSNDPKTMDQVSKLKNDVFKQLAQKAAARIK